LRAGRPKTSIFETFTPEYTGPSNPFSDFYRNDPYRRGNPYNPNAMRTSRRKRWTISDYALVNNPDADLFSSNLLKALKLGKLKDWAHIVSDALVKGESYDTRNNKRAAVTANG
jgi:hypothetical protein